VNKATNCVCLTHIPTNISVKVHDSRNLGINRHIALKRLTEKVEYSVNGRDSKMGRRINRI
jgi:protein subunit release factor A